MGLRSGTENTPYIIGMGKAAEELGKSHPGETYGKIMRAFSDRVKENLAWAKPVFNCKSDETGLPNTVSVGFSGVENLTAGEIVRKCCEKNLIIAAGSACDSGKSCKSLSYSSVLKNSGVGLAVGVSTLRVSCGFWNTQEDGLRAADILADVVTEINDAKS